MRHTLAILTGLSVMVFLLVLSTQTGCSVSNDANMGTNGSHVAVTHGDAGNAGINNPTTRPVDTGKNVAKTKRPDVTPDFDPDPDPGTLSESGYGPAYP